MKALIIGGTRYFGKRLALSFLSQGHELYVMSRTDLPAELARAHHFKMDRSDLSAMQKIFTTHTFDVVFDQVCYAPNEAHALNELLQNTNTRHVHTSTTSIYERDGELIENQFDPRTAPVKMGERSDFSYGEGKRMCEAVLFQGGRANVTAMRIPVVFGPDDYTERLLNLVRRIKAGAPIVVPNPQAQFSLVHAADAARALEWLATCSLCEPINIASPEPLTIGELIGLIERTVNNKANLISVGPDEAHNLLADKHSRFSQVTKAKAHGFEAQPLDSWLPALVRTFAQQV